MDELNWFMANWEAITASVLVFLASVDKIALVFFKTARNLIDSWTETFGSKGE